MKFLSPGVALYLCKSTIWSCLKHCCHVWAGAPNCYLYAASLKLVSAILYQIFISHQMTSLKKYEKWLLFYLKSSFRSRDIQFFVFLSSPLFLPVSHCFRGWWKINLKVCDIINCLNKNLITHLVWYLKKEKSMTLKLWPLI